MASSNMCRVYLSIRYIGASFASGAHEVKRRTEDRLGRGVTLPSVSERRERTNVAASFSPRSGEKLIAPPPKAASS